MFVAFRFPFLGLFMLAMLPGFIVGTLISYFLTENNRPCVASTAPPTPAFDPYAQLRADCRRLPGLAAINPDCPVLLRGGVPR